MKFVGRKKRVLIELAGCVFLTPPPPHTHTHTQTPLSPPLSLTHTLSLTLLKCHLCQRQSCAVASCAPSFIKLSWITAELAVCATMT